MSVLKYEEKIFRDIKYLIRYPNNYKEGDKYPVIMFFHGAGSRGNDINVLRNNPYFQITDKYEDFPFITVAPLCSANTWFDMFTDLENLVINEACAEFADRRKIYAMGASMGGYAVWQMAMSLPDVFAAVVPICGGGMYWNAGRMVNVPVWAFHGQKDSTVFVEESQKMTEAVKNSGGNSKLTVYPNNNHDAWSDTYANKEVFKWLLEQENTNLQQIKDIYNNSKIYG